MTITSQEISEYSEIINRMVDNGIELSNNEFLDQTSGFSGSLSSISKLFSHHTKGIIGLKFDEHKVSWSNETNNGYVADFDNIWGKHSINLPAEVFFKNLKMLKDAKVKNIVFIAYPKAKKWMVVIPPVNKKI